MSFKGLELSFHDDPLLKQVGQSRHNNRIEHINLEEETIADMIAVERYAFDQGDSRYEACILSILIASIAHSESMINGKMQSVYEGSNLSTLSVSNSWLWCLASPTFI